MQKYFENYFVKALYEAKIQELIDNYSKRGFIAERNAFVDNQEFDLLLHNSEKSQTLAFEVKIPPVTKDDINKIEQLREKSEELGYNFRLVTVSRPTEYEIEIDWLDEAVWDYVANQEQPQDIEEKAIHVSYEGVDTHIESITIRGTTASVHATGTIYVQLQYGSNSDVAKNIGMLVKESFPFEGQFELDLTNRSVINASVDVDDSDWYE